MGDFERWNTHFSTTVTVELFGLDLHLAQDPSSHNLGTTVWDSSIVLAKYLEKNAKRGELARHKVKGKRTLELGSGMGLGGMAAAMLGSEVVLTDVASVVPLLQRNYENNLSPAALQGSDLQWLNQVGKLTVQELDWAEPKHYAAVQPPYDFVLAADCVYHEQLVEDLLRTLLAVTDAKSMVLVANELRSDSVHGRFMEICEPHFTIKKLSAKGMHPARGLLVSALQPGGIAAGSPTD
ncbi:hypothetical protein WJX72_003942 [[Myrmecia] bisecta]|uniref:Protein N-lysine methyltransferase METTL21A n=1 Tax=[Myrmecia] bisecta TaxID=41462 RepID=A0AAW1PXB1_9CHLO